MDAGMVGLGAAAAMAAGFWQEMKSAFGYISSFVVERAHFDGMVAPKIEYNLKKRWKPLPSGIHFFSGRYMYIKSLSRFSTVPFSVMPMNAVFRRGWRLVMVSYEGNQITIAAFRWTMNFESLVSEAIEDWNGKNQANPKPASELVYPRYRVVTVIGCEKHLGVAGLRRTTDEPIQGQHEPNANRYGAFGENVDITVDKSFMYVYSEYAISEPGKDPLSNLYLEDSVLPHVERVSKWLNNSKWYQDRGIPWNMGWQLSGRGGTGKTSLAKAVASSLDIPVYRFMLETLSDQELVDAWMAMSTPCLALIEELDTVFHGRENLTAHKSLGFATLLNCISGIDSLDGIFLVVTTNHPDSIDPAIGVVDGEDGLSSRPGRIDVAIELGNINEDNRRRMASSILRDWPGQIENLVEGGENLTPAQFQQMCIRFALGKMKS
jgi:hypothetical protein